MSKCFFPDGYRPVLGLYDTQRALRLIKTFFSANLERALDLHRVSAPLFVEVGTGLNDDLNGVERPVQFDVRDGGKQCQVVHSLAKWKRKALKDYCFAMGTGLYTDMNAIRRDEELDNLHSIYVDQWDWEKIIAREDRNTEFLENAVRSIVSCITATELTLRSVYPQLETKPVLERNITFITSQELEDRYPDLTPKMREDAFVKEHKTVFIEQIGAPLKSGAPHDGRAPDYDDWSLNGDLLFWDETLGCALEISSMGIRVDAAALGAQLKAAGCESRRELPFHKALLNGELPLTMGGGIGQSRLSMLLLGTAHIGEVQSSVWDARTRQAAAEAGVPLL